MSVIAIANSDAFEVVDRASGFATAGETPLLALRGRARRPCRRHKPAPRLQNEVRREIVLAQPGGLHARPAARAREAVRGFDATVDVLFDGRKASIASVVGLLGLGAGEGATVELVGRGARAAAIDAVEHELLREAHGEVEEQPARLRSPAPRRSHATSVRPSTLTRSQACARRPASRSARWCVSTMRKSCRPSRPPARRPRKAASSRR